MLDIICSIFDMALIIIFFNATMKKRRESVPFWLFLFIFACIEGLLGFLAQFLSYAKQNHSFYIIAGISLLSLFALSFLYEGKFVHRIFAAITFQLFATLAEVFTFLFIKLFPVETSEKLLGNPVVCSIVSKLFLFLFIMITNIVFLKRKKIFSFQYTLLICIMPLVSIIIMMTIPDQFEMVSNPFSLSFIGSAGLLFINVVNYYLLDNILNVNRLQKEKEQLNQQLAFQSTKYQQISTAYRNTRSLMHDTKKHYFYIEECVKKGNYDIIEDYLKKSMEYIEQSYNRINTGNLVIDAFVSNHMSIAEKENIEFRTDIQVSLSNIQIDDYDFSIILGNLLDNCLNACREIQVPAPRQIEVSIRTTSKELLLHISNTLSHQAKEHEKDEMVHGYGITNVENITLKYYGTYVYYIERDRYHAIVSIPCNIMI